MPLYSQDYDADYPDVAKHLKQRVEAADGLLADGAADEDAGWEAAGGAAAFAATVTSGLIVLIVLAETPAFERSPTEP